MPNRSIFHALDKYPIHQIQLRVLLKISQDAPKIEAVCLTVLSPLRLCRKDIRGETTSITNDNEAKDVYGDQNKLNLVCTTRLQTLVNGMVVRWSRGMIFA